MARSAKLSRARWGESMNNGTAKSSATEARWQRVKRLFHAALQTPPDERAAYLQQACDGDLALQQEIERLLAHDRMAGDFLAEPAAADAAQALLHEQSAAAEGKQIGPYRLLRKI